MLRHSAAVAALWILLSAGAVCASGRAILTLDGKPLVTSPRPTIRNGRLFVPATVFRQVGLAVEERGRREVWVGWPESDVTVTFTLGSKRAKFSYDRHKDLAAPPFLCHGKLMVPLTVVISHTDRMCNTRWDPKTGTVEVHRSPQWLKWRLELDKELREKRKPGWYTTPL